MFVSPSEVAAWTKLRLGQVSPGTEQNQRVQTANCFARVEITGTCSGGWQCIARMPRFTGPLAGSALTNRLISGASKPLNCGLARPRAFRSRLETKPELSGRLAPG